MTQKARRVKHKKHARWTAEGMSAKDVEAALALAKAWGARELTIRADGRITKWRVGK